MNFWFGLVSKLPCLCRDNVLIMVVLTAINITLTHLITYSIWKSLGINWRKYQFQWNYYWNIKVKQIADFFCYFSPVMSIAHIILRLIFLTADYCCNIIKGKLLNWRVYVKMNSCLGLRLVKNQRRRLSLGSLGAREVLD